jgi:hypothetical protein
MIDVVPEAWLGGQGEANIRSFVTPQKGWAFHKVCDARQGKACCHLEVGTLKRPFFGNC